MKWNKMLNSFNHCHHPYPNFIFCFFITLLAKIVASVWPSNDFLIYFGLEFVSIVQCPKYIDIFISVYYNINFLRIKIQVLILVFGVLLSFHLCDSQSGHFHNFFFSLWLHRVLYAVFNMVIHIFEMWNSFWIFLLQKIHCKV